MLENAFDTSVARRVKRAYTSLDSFGLRTGMYLRRYPLLRTILFVYVVSIYIKYSLTQWLLSINFYLIINELHKQQRQSSIDSIISFVIFVQ